MAAVHPGAEMERFGWYQQAVSRRFLPACRDPFAYHDLPAHRKDRERGYRLRDDRGRSARLTPFTCNLTGISHETVSFFINNLKMYK